MWVSSREWNRLIARVDQLEQAHSPYDDPHSITVYQPSFGNFFPMPSERIMLKDLVLRIVSHLGMGLKYRAGHPAGVDMVPLEPPKATGEK